MIVHIEVLVEQKVEGKPLGRHVEHDPRSWEFQVEPVDMATIGAVSWHRRGASFNQGDLGSCTGNALCGVMNTAPFQPTEPHLMTEADAVSVYEAATLVDAIEGSYPPDDTGSSGLAVCKVAKSRGWIKGYRHAMGITQALSALQAGPVITGIPWFEGFDSPDADGMIEIAGQVRGGHELEVISFAPVPGGVVLDGVIELPNSWGAHWGLHGRCRMTARTWSQCLEQRGDVTVPHR